MSDKSLTLHQHDETMAVAKVMADSGAFPTVEKAAQAYAVITIGRSFGLDVGESLMVISLVQGKPNFDVHWQAKRIRELGHDYEVVELNGATCKIRAWRNVKGQLKEVGEVSMTMDRARQIAIHDRSQSTGDPKQKSTLGNKWNYRNWGEDMLYRYCMVRVVRRYFPEVLGGYAPPIETELDAMAEDGIVEGEVVTQEKFDELKDELYGEHEEAHDVVTGEVLDKGQLLNQIVALRKEHNVPLKDYNAWLAKKFEKKTMTASDLSVEDLAAQVKALQDFGAALLADTDSEDAQWTRDAQGSMELGNDPIPGKAQEPY